MRYLRHVMPGKPSGANVQASKLLTNTNIAAAIAKAKQKRAEQVSRWIELTDLHLSQLETNETKRADGRGHRPERGIRAAARELGIDKNEAHRSVKIASITENAKEAARHHCHLSQF